MKFRLSKNDSADIGFAWSCLLCGAIHFREFKAWLYHVNEHDDAPPHYIFDMLDVELQRDFRPLEIMGWTSSQDLTDEEFDALQRIGFLRGISDSKDQVSREDAMTKLKNNQPFHTRVRNFFPFLDLDSVVGPDPDKGW